jgi:hypothetical protein
LLIHLLGKNELKVKVQSNAANHRRQKTERGTSGAFCRPNAFALLDGFIQISRE